MKAKIKLTSLIAIAITCLVLEVSKAQLLTLPATGLNNYHQTDPILSVESIGIGVFAGMGAIPQAVFHINSALIPTSTAFTPGEVFWTDCPGGNATYWRML